MKNRYKFRPEIFLRENGLDNASWNDKSPNLTKVTKRRTRSSTNAQSRKDVDGNQKKDDEGVPPVSQLQLFRYANRFERFLIILGAVCALGGGCLIPATIFLFSTMVQVIVSQEYENAINGEMTATMKEAILDAVQSFAIGNTIIGIVMIFCVYMSVMLFNYTSQMQAFRLRQMYLRSVLHQDISWYDRKMKSGNVATELTEDVIKFEEGIGEKLAIFIDHVAIFIFSIIFSFYYGWKLTLVCLVSAPFTSLILAIVTKVNTVLSRRELDAFGAASSVAQEALSGIKTVVAYGGEYTELKRYKRHLEMSYSVNKKMAFVSGFGFGFLWLGIYASYAVSQWYGIQLIVDQRHLPPGQREYDASVMIAVFFCTMIGAMNIGAVSPYLEVFSVSRAAAAKIFSVIERKSAITSLDNTGAKLDAFRNSIVFQEVEFQYPSRPEIQILVKLNLSIKKGETVALVGSSGCGKSTCIQLLQRFYDPNRGRVLIDGHDIRDLNLTWLRSNIGVVGQEPVLFNRTIAENIRYGNLEATMEMIVNAAKKSNAHDFIMNLPSLGHLAKRTKSEKYKQTNFEADPSSLCTMMDSNDELLMRVFVSKKYETLVGEKGLHMSGGQKQRIAIARALVRDPSILLLDEATSALDTQSESKVQAALNEARKGRTTIIVAHRLTTIRNADRIFVLSSGRVIESGRHDELMNLQGHYHTLVTAQISEFSEAKNHVAPTIDDRMEDIDEDLDPFITDTSEDLNEEDQKELVESKIGMWQILKLNKPEWKLILIAGVASFVVGSATPLFAVLYGDVIKLLSDPRDDYVSKQSSTYAIYFTCAGIVIGVTTCLQIYLLTIASERLTTRLRGWAFGAMLRQEMAWFDQPSNGTGALCAKLSTEAANVKGATGQRIGTIIQSISAIVFAIGLSCYYEWRIGLLGIAFIPIILLITFLHGRVYKKETLNYQKQLERSTKIAVEAVSNIRTVIGLGREQVFFEDYVNAIRQSFEQAKRNTHYRGFIFAFFKSITCFAYAAVLYYGGVLIKRGEIEFAAVFKVSQALITGTVVIGQASAFSPNLHKGMMAAAKIINLIQRKPAIEDPSDPKDFDSGHKVDVKFDAVSFEYATRPGVKILESLNLEIGTAKTVALVGSSGCGKSTVVKLLERFYDPDSGTIKENGTKISTMRLSTLRMSLGLVEQEPTVFARSIRENIAYGDNTRDVLMEEIIEAATRANIHNFVASLPLGYETNLGDKGTMLSGGQKQRIAIARALLRNPRVLLLDEATSALDTESERIVQAALNAAQEGRTCIVIAHRLSTIEEADKICVFHRGKVVENGTHAELIRARGLYYEMLRMQSGTR